MTKYCYYILVLTLQDKVYEEIISCVGNTNEDINQTDLKKLTYMDQVIKETMRMFPVFPAYPRGLTEDTKLSKLDGVKKTSESNYDERRYKV